MVDPVPVTHHQVRLMVAPIKLATQPKKVAAKENGVSHPATQPQACKIMQVTSPSPEVVEVPVPVPAIACPSQAMCPPLFEEPAVSGDEDLRKGASMTSSHSQCD